MRAHFGVIAATLALATAIAAAPSSASFHLMQIEQAVGGVCGNTDRQAIQLRMRFGDQEFVAGKQLKAWDALGDNPIVLLTFPANAPIGNPGSRILVTTGALDSAFGVDSDFTLDERIPDEYLTAGRLTFEDGFGTIYWSLAWGGAAYVGSNLGNPTNDANGDFGPQVGSWLPFSTAQSLRFTGAASAPSTTNLVDYALSTGAATLVNNDGDPPVALGSCLFGDGFVTGTPFAWSTGVGFEYCNSMDDDGDTFIDEDFPLGSPCQLQGGGIGSYQCAPDGRGVICV
jgi:hypothetical protein